jgi:hypothetical protein
LACEEAMMINKAMQAPSLRAFIGELQFIYCAANIGSILLHQAMRVWLADR